MQRRSFLGAMLAAAVAPSIVRAQSLMPVRQLAPSSTEAVVMRSVFDAMKGEFGVVTLYSTLGKVLARLPVHENPMLYPVHLRTSDFSHGICGKAMYEHPLLGSHEFAHAVYGMDVPKEATEITISNFMVYGLTPS